MKPFFYTILCWSLLLGESLFANSVVRFSSNVGEIDMELFDTETPLTVANFLSYVNAGRYNQSFIHRSVPGFVIQGGGFGLNGNSVLPVVTNAAVQNEPGISNLRGTVAMAKLGGYPNSATSQWFINLEDNSGPPANLDAQNGGFTVFGRVVGNGVAVADRIAAFSTYNATAELGGVFSDLPLQSPALTINNLILFPAVRALPTGTVVREFDFSSGDQGFTFGFADLPADYDPEFYNLVADHRNLPAELGVGKGLFISGINHSDDLWMFWKKKLTGLQPNTEYQVVLDIEMASNVAPGLVGVGGAPGESVYVKAGASQAEPLVAPDSEGQLRLTVDKGNQSTSGSAAAVLGNVAKENDESEQYALLHRNNRSVQQSATTSADGSLWIFFGTDSGFEGATSLYYTHAAAVLMPKAKPSLTWSTPAAIAYGTALGASQLNATATVAGNFTYTPSAGAVLPVGNHTLNVVFTPTDTGNYTTASANVTLKVNDAPAVSAPPPSVGAPPPSGGTSQPERTKKGKSSKKSSVSKSKSTTGSPAKKSGAKKVKKK
jgi:cyclophilin family peptidyl-prolyl cis-trans isomerase